MNGLLRVQQDQIGNDGGDSSVYSSGNFNRRSQQQMSPMRIRNSNLNSLESNQQLLQNTQNNGSLQTRYDSPLKNVKKFDPNLFKKYEYNSQFHNIKRNTDYITNQNKSKSLKRQRISKTRTSSKCQSKRKIYIEKMEENEFQNKSMRQSNIKNDPLKLMSQLKTSQIIELSQEDIISSSERIQRLEKDETSKQTKKESEDEDFKEEVVSKKKQMETTQKQEDNSKFKEEEICKKKALKEDDETSLKFQVEDVPQMKENKPDLKIKEQHQNFQTFEINAIPDSQQLIKDVSEEENEFDEDDEFDDFEDDYGGCGSPQKLVKKHKDIDVIELYKKNNKYIPKKDEAEKSLRSIDKEIGNSLVEIKASPINKKSDKNMIMKERQKVTKAKDKDGQSEDKKTDLDQSLIMKKSQEQEPFLEENPFQVGNLENNVEIEFEYSFGQKKAQIENQEDLAKNQKIDEKSNENQGKQQKQLLKLDDVNIPKITVSPIKKPSLFEPKTKEEEVKKPKNLNLINNQLDQQQTLKTKKSINLNILDIIEDTNQIDLSDFVDNSNLLDGSLISLSQSILKISPNLQKSPIKNQSEKQQKQLLDASFLSDILSLDNELVVTQEKKGILTDEILFQEDQKENQQQNDELLQMIQEKKEELQKNHKTTSQRYQNPLPILLKQPQAKPEQKLSTFKHIRFNFKLQTKNMFRGHTIQNRYSGQSGASQQQQPSFKRMRSFNNQIYQEDKRKEQQEKIESELSPKFQRKASLQPIVNVVEDIDLDLQAPAKLTTEQLVCNENEQEEEEDDGGYDFDQFQEEENENVENKAANENDYKDDFLDQEEEEEGGGKDEETKNDVFENEKQNDNNDHSDQEEDNLKDSLKQKQDDEQANDNVEENKDPKDQESLFDSNSFTSLSNFDISD